MPYQSQSSLLRAPIAGLLAWLVPGLGHIFLGHRGRGIVFLLTITATFWTGVAIGGVRATVDPHERTLWFLAQLCTGSNTGAAYALNVAIAPTTPSPGWNASAGPWLSAEVGVHYTGVAGLLNLLVILDALGRVEAKPSPARVRRQHSKGVT